MIWIDRLFVLPAPVVAAFAIGMVALVGAVDFATGPEFGCSLFHLAPIFLASWVLGRRGGFAIAGLAAAVWVLVDLTEAHRYSHAWMPYLNASIRLGFFSVFVALIARLKSQTVLARQDVLTGIANRLAFREAAELEIERSRRYRSWLSFVFLDCDRFKEVNDRLGHQAGDRLLMQVASLLRSHCRTIDTVARIGGDEFAVLLPETDAERAQVVVRKLHQAFRSIDDLPGIRVSLSAGVATFQAPSESVDEIMRSADVSMYQAKTQAHGALR